MIKNKSLKYLTISIAIALFTPYLEARSCFLQSDDMKGGIPVYNYYNNEDGGYVAIYSHKKKGKGSYEIGKKIIGKKIYVIALLRVQGAYEASGVFVPKGYKYGDDITQDANLKNIVLPWLPKEWKLKAKDIWFGGDTGGFCPLG